MLCEDVAGGRAVLRLDLARPETNLRDVCRGTRGEFSPMHLVVSTLFRKLNPDCCRDREPTKPNKGIQWLYCGDAAYFLSYTIYKKKDATVKSKQTDRKGWGKYDK